MWPLAKTDVSRHLAGRTKTKSVDPGSLMARPLAAPMCTPEANMRSQSERRKELCSMNQAKL